MFYNITVTTPTRKNTKPIADLSLPDFETRKKAKCYRLILKQRKMLKQKTKIKQLKQKVKHLEHLLSYRT